MTLVKTTTGQEGIYTPIGNEVFIRIEVQREGKDDDGDDIPNTTFSQPIFLNYQ